MGEDDPTTVARKRPRARRKAAWQPMHPSRKPWRPW